MPKTQWDSVLYQHSHSYVFEYGADLLELLNPKPGEEILDLGCGTGQLANQISSLGANIVGIDSSEDMVKQAQENYPELKFTVADARDFSDNLKVQFDAVFSNAALHWVKDKPEEVVKNIYRVLKPDGRFVVEMGGKANVQKIVDVIYDTLIINGYKTREELDEINPWYFPSLAEYSSILENVGFRIGFASHFDRLTKLDSDEGMIKWIKMYANCFFADFDARLSEELISKICDKLKPGLYRDGTWFADYVRLRIVSSKLS